MTVSQNLMLPLQRVRGLTVTEAKERVQITLRAFGLDDRSESVAGSLSGGLKQRLMLARALGLEPKFLILDEVTSAMDAEWTERIRLHLLQYRQEYGATIVLISHQLNFVRRVATSVAYLANGKLIEYGAASNVLENPSSVSLQQFLMNA
jgi:ABC-type methionine transport system ATPase subunit